MKIYVLTENNYLYNGIAHTLASRTDCQCVKLSPQNKSNYIISRLSKSGDIFIIASEYSNMNFSMLMELNQSNASVIIATNNFDWKISSIFRFSTISRNFHMFDLLQAIRLIKPVSNKDVLLPRITASEKEVLMLTMNGVRVDFISSRLNIAAKTAYAHQRSAFKKLGIRKIQDITKLPYNYINYIVHAN